MSIPTPVSKHGRLVVVGDRIALFGNVTAVTSAGVVTMQIENADVNLASQLATIVVKASQLAHS
jgi:hypothetical protein